MQLSSLLTPAYWTDIAWELARKAGGPPPLDLPDRPRKFPNVRMNWPPRHRIAGAEKWLEPLQRGFQELAEVRIVDTPTPAHGALVVPISIDDTSYRIAIDIADKPGLDEAVAHEADVYFKMQYPRGGYGRADIVPGGFVPNHVDLYSYLPSLWAIQEARPPCYDVYGRFGAHFATEERRRALDLLSAQRHFRFEGELRIIRYSRYLREVARSKICVNLPGNGDLCFRLFDYLAVGAFVVSHPLHTELPATLRSGEHLVYTEPDFDDLVELCRYYLAHDEERERIQRNAREYFLKHIHYQSLASYYLNTALCRLARTV